MNTRTAWIVYTLLRLAFFAVPFAVLYLIGWHWLLAAGIATLIAAALSVILLSKPRERAAISIQEWRDRGRTADDVVEDDAVDAGERIADRAEAPDDVAADGDRPGRDEAQRSR